MKRNISVFSDSQFDVLIIGGGITGAAVAYEAASRGLKVALFEKDDFGGATSAATSRMIHGGLRYLAKLEFGIVRESLKERRILCNIAPNFVHPVPNVILLREGDKVPAWFVKIGLYLYDLLSFDQRHLQDKDKHLLAHRSLKNAEIIKMEPQLNLEGLKGGLVYSDCLSISPERLTLAFIRSAMAAGAKIANYAEVVGFDGEVDDLGKKLNRLSVTDRLTGNEFIVSGKLIINCAGPWVDKVLALVKPGKTLNRLKWSEGIHLITRGLAVNEIVAATTSSGKHCFIVPWRGHSLIGTTDKEYFGEPGDYKVTRGVIEEFLKEINPVFSAGKPLTIQDITYAYGGLRPLVSDKKEDVYKSSRKYEIVDHVSEGITNLISVEGGKFTTSRSLAEKTVDLISRKLKIKSGKSISASNFLRGCEISDFRKFTDRMISENPGLSVRQITFLVENYGTEASRIIQLMENNNHLSEVLNNDGETCAEVIYAIREEMAVTLSDILFRRTGIGTLGNPGIRIIEKVAETAAQELGWDRKKIDFEISQVLKKYTYEDFSES
jgi:glycerol-3-phosphate dehydrogenase